MIKVSAGTAHVLGLKQLKTDAPPTTAYLMAGEKCSRSCGFCPQGRDSQSRSDLLSRVTWPGFQMQEVVPRIAAAFQSGEIKRTCLQVVNSREAWLQTREMIAELTRQTDVPICLSCTRMDMARLEEMLAAGVERIGLPLDVANPELYSQIKGGSWGEQLAFIEAAARTFPGRISTHLIVGLGEREEEICQLLQRFTDQGITVALFAFTPVPGTALADRPPPPLAQYRRIQAAHWLIKNKLVRVEQMIFTASGRLVYLGAREQLRQWLACGRAFQTSGCPDCNRPYYNEKPGGIMYNYPRPLTEAEREQELAFLFSSLKTEPKEEEQCSGA
ncbi:MULTISPECIES: radical SAM protein [unclassified Carboxydocella]|uniref:radical SAM protein n=1 Tax=unclassified Carboxydocella TaxID=2685367 RepID=UPI0009AD44CA|nr:MULTISPECIES: radical SAM protein [unclassified Carboxydocella]GAW27834.1 biotin synthase [Carboxydocella sp. ULO1]GAW32291.1 biotin synthase [Carboxydocella sp. JDF658]